MCVRVCVCVCVCAGQKIEGWGGVDLRNIQICKFENYLQITGQEYKDNDFAIILLFYS